MIKEFKTHTDTITCIQFNHRCLLCKACVWHPSVCKPASCQASLCCHVSAYPVCFRFELNWHLLICRLLQRCTRGFRQSQWRCVDPQFTLHSGVTHQLLLSEPDLSCLIQVVATLPSPTQQPIRALQYSPHRKHQLATIGDQGVHAA